MNIVGDMRQRLEQMAAGFAMRAGNAANSDKADAAQADDGDVLALALADVARHYGRSTVPLALVAGLPLVDGRLPLEHVALAATRAGLVAEVVAVPLAELKPHDLPVLVMMDEGGCDVLWELRDDKQDGECRAVLSAAGRTTRVALPLQHIAQAESRKIVRLRPLSQAENDGVVASGGTQASYDWLVPAFRISKRFYAEAIAATVALNVLALALPLFTMNVYDRVLPNAVETTLWALAIGVVLATTFDFVIKTLRASFVDIASRRADVVLSNYIYGRLLGARMQHQSVSVGVRANALREFETIREFLNSATLTAFGDVPFILLFLIILWVVAGPLVWIVVLSVPVVVAASWLTQRRVARLTERSFRETAQKNAVVVETLVGMESIKAAGAESWAAAKWEGAVSDHIRSSHAIRDISNLGINLVFAVQTLTQIAMVVAGFYLVAAGHLTTGALIAGTMLAGRALQPLGQIAMLISRLSQTRLAFRALTDIVNLEQERSAGQRLHIQSDFTGALTAEGLNFGYDKDTPPCLVDVSFEIRPGEKVGLIGSIGSGKSTLLKIIHGVYHPSAGRMLADGIPVHQIDPALLRANIGLALQGGDLFHGTIRSNIALADSGASDAEVLAAVRSVGAQDWILRLPKGLDTPVRERGAGLSGGQRQFVALARAVFRGPKILLLDEPTSDMDLQSEHRVVQALKRSMAGRTVIAVSHRPAILALVDRLIVLEAGRKLLDGPKDVVLKQLELLNAERTGGRQAKAPTQMPTSAGQSS